MKVEAIELDLDWPNGLEIYHLRKFVLEEIQSYGYPLRWAITEVKETEQAVSFRKLIVEAVVIIP